MTNLGAGAIPAREGFVVTFRLDGPLYQLDNPSFEWGPFLFHYVTVDLSESSASGRNEETPITLKSAEIISKVEDRGQAARSAKKRSSGNNRSPLRVKS